MFQHCHDPNGFYRVTTVLLMFLSVTSTALGWDIHQVNIQDEDLVIVDIEVPSFGPWAGYPWVCLTTDDQSRMMWVSDPDAPFIEQVPGTPEKILFGAEGQPILVYYDDSNGLSLFQRNEMGDWENVFNYPHYHSIWMDEENALFWLIESEITGYESYEYHGFEDRTLFLKLLDTSTFEISANYPLDQLHSHWYCFRACDSIALRFKSASAGIHFEFSEFSSYIPGYDPIWGETVKIPQISLTGMTNQDQENRLELSLDVHDRIGSGWIAHWLQGSEFWTVMHGGAYLMSQRPLEDLIRLNSTSSAVIYHTPMLVYNSCHEFQWQLPEIVTTDFVNHSKMCYQNDAVWISYSTNEGVYIVHSDGFPESTTKDLPISKISDSQPSGPKLTATPSPTPETPVTPSPTPGIPVTPSPTPETPVLCGIDGVVLEISNSTCRPGDTFTLAVSICNATEEDLENIPLFCALEIGEQYLYYPAWTEGVNWQTIPFLRSGMTRVVIFDPLKWPEDTGSGTVKFIAAITDSDITRIFGSIDEIEFSWID